MQEIFNDKCANVCMYVSRMYAVTAITW